MNDGESFESVYMAENEDDDVFTSLAAMPSDPPEKRDVCSRCGRPVSVGLCKYFPKERINVSSTVYIIQHPNEEKRVLRTAPILTACLPIGKCHIIRGKRFSEKGHPDLAKVCSSPNTLVLFPGPEAVDIGDVPVPPTSSNGLTQGYNIIIMDGTWHQATSIYKSNKIFHVPQQVQFQNAGCSEYTIRTQPTDSSVSTVESAAIALSVLERNPAIKEAVFPLHSSTDPTHIQTIVVPGLPNLPDLTVLAQPLRALCQYQLNHGAVKHHSKEFLKDHPELPQYRIFKSKTRTEPT